MSYIVVIRECKHTDAPAANEVIRNAYLSNVTNSWCNALFKEVSGSQCACFVNKLHSLFIFQITFQSIIMLAAFMFIFIGVPFFYCVTAIPLVLLLIYVVIYANFALKAMEVISTKRPLQSWVAEVYQPYFFTRNPQNFSYKIIPEHRLEKECIDTANYQRKIIGTVSVMNHFVSNNSAWLFRLAVDKRLDLYFFCN